MTNMFNKRLIPKRELKNPHLQDYLTEDNKVHKNNKNKIKPIHFFYHFFVVFI